MNVSRLVDKSVEIISYEQRKTVENKWTEIQKHVTE